VEDGQMIEKPPNYYQPSYLGAGRLPGDFSPRAVSCVKKRCAPVSCVIQCPRIAERLPKFREEFSAGSALEAPLQYFPAGTGFLRRIE
jgi:hypothetical protein